MDVGTMITMTKPTRENRPGMDASGVVLTEFFSSGNSFDNCCILIQIIQSDLSLSMIYFISITSKRNMIMTSLDSNVLIGVFTLFPCRIMSKCLKIRKKSGLRSPSLIVFATKFTASLPSSFEKISYPNPQSWRYHPIL